MKNMKRLGAILLSLSLLCGLLLSGVVLPASATTEAQSEVEKFSFDFGEMESVSYTSTGQNAGEYSGFTTDDTKVTSSQPLNTEFGNTIDFQTLNAAGKLDADAYAAYRKEILAKFSEYTFRSKHVSGGNGVPAAADFDLVAQKFNQGYTAFTGHAAGGYIMATNDNSGNANNFFKTTSTLIPKDKNGELIKLKNFEATFTVRVTGVGGGFANRKYGVGLVFRQKTAGKLNASDDWPLGQEQGIVMLTPDGISAGAGTGLSAVTSGNTMTANYSYSGAARHDGNEHFTVTVRVVNNDLKMRVYSHGWLGANNSIQFDNFEGGNEEDTVINLSNYNEEGYIGFASLAGRDQTCSGFGEIEITKLDDNGNPVDITPPKTFNYDFGKMESVSYTSTGQNAGEYSGFTTDDTKVTSSQPLNTEFGNTIDFQTLNAAGKLDADAYAAYRKEILAKFSEYTFRSKHASGGNGVPAAADFDLAAQKFNQGYTAFTAHAAGGYIMATNDNSVNTNNFFKTTSTLIPKDENGELIKLKNFEATFTVRVTGVGGGFANRKYGVGLVFRQKTAGKLNASDDWPLGQEQGIVMLTPDGISAGAGTGLSAVTSGNTMTANYSYSGAARHDGNEHFTVKVRVVNNDLKMRVYSHGWLGANNSIQFDNFEGGKEEKTVINLSNYNEEGYIGFASLAGRDQTCSGFGKIEITKLDDNGNPVDITMPEPIEKFEVDFADFTAPADSENFQNADATAYAAYRAQLLTKFSEIVCRSNSVSGGTGIPQATDFDLSQSIVSGYTAFTGHNAAGYIISTNDNTLNTGAHFKSTATLVPKDSKGNLIKAYNFETTFTAWAAAPNSFPSRPFGFTVAFRQQTAGKMNSGADWYMGTDQGLVMVTPGGTVAGAGEGLTALANGNAVVPNAIHTGSLHGGTEHFTVTVRVVNNDLKLRVISHGWKGANNTVQFDNFEGGKDAAQTISLSGYNKEGYIGFALTSGKDECKAGFGQISFTALDANGKEISVNACAGGHTVAAYTSNNDATCGANGTESGVCSVCGATVTKEVPESATGEHDYSDWEETKAPTCNEAGSKQKVCSVCGDTVTEAIEATDEHTSTGDWQKDENNHWKVCDTDGCGAQVELGAHEYTNYTFNEGSATCTADGTETGTCVCGATDTRTKENSATGHSYTNYVPNNDATCVKLPTETAYCDHGCGTSDTRNVEGGEYGDHVYDDDFDTTCNCEGCGETRSVVGTTEDAGKTYVEVALNNGEEIKGAIWMSNGTVSYPVVRVGFQEGGNADRYEVIAPEGTDLSGFELQYDKYVPTFDNPNIASAGNSYSDKFEGGALRFVQRFTRTVEGEKEYVVIDGEQYEILDYGVVTTSAAGLAANGATTPEQIKDIMVAGTTANWTKSISFKEAGVHYDVCDAYIDMALSLYNIKDDAAEYYTRAYVKVQNGEEEHVFYGAVTIDNFGAHK